MSELTLIPFGFKLSEQIYVDVSEVGRGRKCECICPSCKTALIARQGSKNEWHFAHDSKDISSNTIKECKYSFWVSVILMAKQILRNTNTITLPPLTMFSNNGTKYEIAKKTIVECNDLKTDAVINSITVDAMFTLGQHIVVISLAAPHRDINHFSEIKSSNIGILEISLNDAVQWLYGNRNKGNYRKILEKNIVKNIRYKNWIYHPRQITIEKKYNVRLNKDKQHNVNFEESKYITVNNYSNNPIKDDVRSVIYGECVICGKSLNSSGGCPDCQRRF